MVKITGKVDDLRYPTFRGNLIIYSRNGQLLARKWPRKQTKTEKAKSADQRAWMQRANDLMKYADPYQLQMSEQLSRNTPLMPRDLLTKAMAGRIFDTMIIDGQRFHSMAYRKDVSDFLDVLGSEPFTLMVRDVDFWKPLPKGTEESYLYQASPTALPAWIPIADTDVPLDGFIYARVDQQWFDITDVLITGFFPEAPIDGNAYVRWNGGWITVQAALDMLGNPVLGAPGSGEAGVFIWQGGAWVNINDTDAIPDLTGYIQGPDDDAGNFIWSAGGWMTVEDADIIPDLTNYVQKPTLSSSVKIWQSGAWATLTAAMIPDLSATYVTKPASDGNTYGYRNGAWVALDPGAAIDEVPAPGWTISYQRTDALIANLTVGTAGTYRLLFPSTELDTSGTKCRLRLRGPSSGSYTIDICYIGRKGSAFPNLNSAPVQVLFSGSPGITVTAGQTVYSDEIAFPINAALDYVVSLYRGGTTMQFSTWSQAVGQFWSKASHDETTLTISAGFNNSNRVIFDRLEVYN